MPSRRSRAPVQADFLVSGSGVAGLRAALELSRGLELDAQFEKLVAKEFKMKVRDVRKLKEQAAELLAKAEVSGE